jgi:pimeloyl-ACP methyl ester carboxylesterase
MASFEHEGSTLAYEVRGSGPAVLALAPGGMRSATALWDNAPFNPLSVLSDRFTVISMDQRNAGASRGPVREDDGWGSFLEDQLALLDHLGIGRCAALGMCIGGPYVMNLLRAQPERFYAGVLLQPIGLDNNHDAFLGMVDSWAEALLPERPDLSPETLTGLRDRMFSKDFLFAVSEEDVRRCPVPLQIMLGKDLFHPESTSRRIAELAPRAALIEAWKGEGEQEAAVAALRTFLLEHAGEGQ